MRRRFSGLAPAISCALLCLAHCAVPQDAQSAESDLVIFIGIRGLESSIQTVQAHATLDGVPARETFESSKDLQDLYIRLPHRESSYGLLEVRVLGLTESGCKLASGQAAFHIEAGQQYYEDKVNLVRLSTPVCPMTIESPADAEIISDPLGIDCGTRCEKDFPVDTLVTLTARRGDRPIVTTWGVPCRSMSTGITNTCTLPIYKALSIAPIVNDVTQ